MGRRVRHGNSHRLGATVGLYRPLHCLEMLNRPPILRLALAFGEVPVSSRPVSERVGDEDQGWRRIKDQGWGFDREFVGYADGAGIATGARRLFIRHVASTGRSRPAPASWLAVAVIAPGGSVTVNFSASAVYARRET